MRPTVIRLIVGGALGIAFSLSLWLPGTVVFPEDAPIRHLAAPDVPSTMIVRAAPVAAPKKAPETRRVVQPVHVPVVRTASVTRVVRHAPSRSRPAAKPVTRATPPAQQQLTPLLKKRKKAKRQTWEKEERPDETRERERDRGDEDEDENEDEDHGDDDEGGDDRGGDGIDG